jgi:RNA recognition motif-containing protein
MQQDYVSALFHRFISTATTRLSHLTLSTPSRPRMDGQAAGSSKKATIYVGGFAPEVDEEQLLQAFVTFGMLRPSSSPPS